MTDNGALDAAIVAAEKVYLAEPDEGRAFEAALKACVEKYLEVRNSEAVAWLTRIDEHQFITDWKPTAESWERDGWKIEPLFPAPSAGDETVKVKELTWHRNFAHTDFGLFYMISVEEDGAILEKIAGTSTMKSAWPSVEEAKAAAQADYEHRILSALEDAPFIPAVIENPDAGISELVIEDAPTITGSDMTVRPLYRMSDRQIIGFQWDTALVSHPPQSTGWQPIGTAPKDGGFLDLWVEFYDQPEGDPKGPKRWTDCHWNGEAWENREGLTPDAYMARVVPTHWAPLPTAPTPETDKEKGR